MKLQWARLSLRFVVPLALVLALCAYVVVPLLDNLTLRWFVRDLDIRSKMLASTLEEPLLDHVPARSRARINQLFNKAIEDERLYALAFCDVNGNRIYSTSTYPAAVGCRDEGEGVEGGDKALVHLPRGPVHVARSLLMRDGEVLGRLVLVHDMSFIERRSSDTRKFAIVFFILLGTVISMITVAVAHLSWRGWINGVRGLLRGELLPASHSRPPPEVKPLVGDLRALLHEYHLERQNHRDSAQEWTPERLRELLRGELAGDEVLVVSNREPYIHQQTANGIEVARPASGLVTAVEAVMRACSGTWIAHGSGNADREVVDKHDRVPVPPECPEYTLRRVWLSKEEEQGYYYGFANEGLWPLCHIAHVRPVFRSSDWEQYVKVNRRFADAVIAEARTDDPVILVQDYHFALLPRMVREALPRATVITFWHIPWPNPESFGICPWREEILAGMLGSTIIGFHTPFHRKNFLETVDRYLETRIESEASTISYGGKLTQVEPYPISIAWPGTTEVSSESQSECRANIRKALALPADHLLGIGVDRLDYTKGIIERFQAVERMLELNPSMVGRFTFVQIAAPTRSSLDEYQSFEARVRALALRINQRFSNGNYMPILLKAEHHDQYQLNRYYRAADVCMVTSLHDGMNLVAKEFIAARSDEKGVLLLSQFTGAARELHEALIVNPYHIEQSADALYRAITMPEAEQRERMRSMRTLVKDFNVYRWAGHMLLDAARLRKRERVMQRIDAHHRPPLRRVV
ncbi:trehalose-6-phosphate synthase [Noviherbaspirillum sp. CPCC 100848]|uniref:Trehalose-6-phosphate synthase n=1 Tax=Noviherbaspirillum album TaxID=3080276 RepID=A0ABU6JHP4_9BURK|nr:trehalose-6-phosphate synthase [Noviherbaspirillum sp. CPCC 100848]MEC4723167.1 trehalose-6-phosphate synthase [Noviherbaspirillum sp. CPCC 100848]